jgi:hypothetical protein
MAAAAPLLLAAAPSRAEEPPATVWRISGPSTPEGEAAEPPRPIPPADELSAPRLPAPFVLPELSHPHFDAGVGWTMGTATPDDPSRGTSTIALVRAHAEARVGRLRRVYVGGTLPVAAATLAGTDAGAKAALGNFEAHVRVVFPMPSWLAFGALLGVTAPTARFDRNGPAAAAASAAASMDPTDVVQLTPGAVALRPAYDVRILRGPFVVQVRQGLDVVIDSSGATRARTEGRILAHAGVLIGPDVEVSLEGTQVYFFDSEVSDDHRSAFTLGPNARLSLGAVDVGAGVLTNVYTPLDPTLERVVALRLSLIGHL